MWLLPKKCMHTLYLRTSDSRRVINCFRKALVASIYNKVRVISSRTWESQRVSKSWLKARKAFTSLKNSCIAKNSFSLPREPNTHSTPQAALGTPLQFQGSNRPLHAWLHMMKGSTKVNQQDSYEKRMANLRERPHGQSRDSAKHPKTCEKNWGVCETARGVNRSINKKLQIKKRNILREVDRNHKRTSLTE